MRNGLSIPEAVAYALVFATSLTVVLAYSAIWSTLYDVSSVLPARYLDLLGLLPMTTNTALAFALFAAGSLGSVALMRHPSVGLALLTGTALATAGYPYGQLRWHRAFFHLPIDDTEPTVGLWIRGTIPVLLLLLVPIVLQVRLLLARYKAKGIDHNELNAARSHLLRLSVQNAVVAVVFTVGAGLLLYLIRQAAGAGGQALAGQSVLVMVGIAFLLVAAIGVGSGVFQKDEPAGAESTPSDEGSPRAR